MFFLFHRERLLERARAGVDGMGAQARQDLRSSTDSCAARATPASRAVGQSTTLPAVRYCITLDSDTQLPRDAAANADRHHRAPAERAGLDPAAGRVTEGYGILQPRVSVTMASAAGSLFARTYAGHTGVDPYTTAVSDVYQDLFGEGIFTGKGLPTTSTRSWRRSTAACRKTRCCRTISSKDFTRARRSSPTSKWWTTTRRTS